MSYVYSGFKFRYNDCLSRFLVASHIRSPVVALTTQCLWVKAVASQAYDDLRSQSMT